MALADDFAEELQAFARHCNVFEELTGEERQELAFNLRDSGPTLRYIQQVCHDLHENCLRYGRFRKDVHFSLVGGHERLQVFSCKAPAYSVTLPTCDSLESTGIRYNTTTMIIEKLRAGSPASKRGITVGDMLLEVNGKKLECDRAEDFYNKVLSNWRSLKLRRRPTNITAMKGVCVKQLADCDMLWIAMEGQEYDEGTVTVCKAVSINLDSARAIYPLKLGFRNGGFLNAPRYTLVNGLSLCLCDLLPSTWCLELSFKDPYKSADEHIDRFIDIWREKNGLSASRDRSRSPARAAITGNSAGSAIDQSRKIKESGQCFMMETQFQTNDGQLVSASQLSVGDKILDRKGLETSVEWCQKHPKQKRLVVDFHCKLLTVTGSHRVVMPDGEIIDAKQLEAKKQKVLKVSSSIYVELEKITKRHAYVEAMELQFAGDATVATCMPSILTKGSDPQCLAEMECKEETTDQEGMNLDAPVGQAHTSNEAGTSNELELVVADLPRYPSTDDGF